MAESNPMIITTIISSISVKPLFRFVATITSLLYAIFIPQLYALKTGSPTIIINKSNGAFCKMQDISKGILLIITKCLTFI